MATFCHREHPWRLWSAVIDFVLTEHSIAILGACYHIWKRDLLSLVLFLRETRQIGLSLEIVVCYLPLASYYRDTHQAKASLEVEVCCHWSYFTGTLATVPDRDISGGCELVSLHGSILGTLTRLTLLWRLWSSVTGPVLEEVVCCH